LFVSDPPVVSLTLGSKLDAADIKEGDDVYFECKIKSHPKVQKVMWKKDVSFSQLSSAKTNTNLFGRKILKIDILK